MSDEDESTPSGFIVAAERAILRFLSDRKANAASREDPGTSTVNQMADDSGEMSRSLLNYVGPTLPE